MTKTTDDNEALISLIRTRGEAAEDAAGAITLIRLIPCAGGAIAGIISEKANQRRFENVCDVLSDLNARLESRGSTNASYLTPLATPSSSIYSSGLINSFNPKGTPLEDCRTEFGREFLRFYR